MSTKILKIQRVELTCKKKNLFFSWTQQGREAREALARTNHELEEALCDSAQRAADVTQVEISQKPARY